MEQKTTSELWQNVEIIANRYHDGHYSIFKFTSGYKGCFGTPVNLREEISKMKSFETLRELLMDLIYNH